MKDFGFVTTLMSLIFLYCLISLGVENIQKTKFKEINIFIIRNHQLV